MSAPTGTPVGITGLGRSYHTRTGTVAAVDGVDLDLRPGTLLVVVGPSGCGKSTLLRLVAGIEQADTGRIAIGGAVVTDPARGIDVPPQRRRVGMVFQSFSVWPHLDVAENVAYPLRVQRVPRAERRDRVEEALALVGLAGLGRRRAHELSGGQQQRVAIARASVQRPAVLLLDEPLSALDAHLRERLSDEIVDLHRTLDLTTVHVTHDRREALAMADEIAVMVDGRIVQRGTPGELRTAPTHRVTAEILSEATILEGVAGAVTGRGAQEVTTALGTAPAAAPGGPRPVGSVVPVAVLPGALHLEAAGGPGRAARGPTARVLRVVHRQHTVLVRVEAAGVVLNLRLSPPVDVAVGAEVLLVTGPGALRLVEPGGGAA